ncbi:MAG: FHA domain-containing protein, partial [Actinomycetota bacterium]
GRLEGNDIIIPDPSVSRHHAEIRRENDNFFVLDLDSTNGTWLNGKRISKAPVRDGARIGLGKVLLEFRRF